MHPDEDVAEHAHVLLDAEFNTSGDEAEDTTAVLMHGSDTMAADAEDPLSDQGSLEGEDEQTLEALAEQSESDDEVLTSITDDTALAAHLQAEVRAVPRWAPSPAVSKANSSEAIRVASLGSKGKSPAKVVTNAPVPSTQPRHAVVARQALPGKATAPSVIARAKDPTTLSKAEMRLQIERPAFRTPTKISTTSLPQPSSTPVKLPSPEHVPVATGSTADIYDLEDFGDNALTAAAVYQVVYPSQGGALSLKAQHIDVQYVLRATRQRLERDIVSCDAFPDARDRGRSVRMAMVETVKSLRPVDHYAQLTLRMVTDGDFTRALSVIPNQRISTFRGRVKEKSDIAVAAAYGLVAGTAHERVEWLLPQLIYIYPTDFERKHIAEGKPYQHPIVTAVLREVFFKGPKAFAGQNDDLFISIRKTPNAHSAVRNLGVFLMSSLPQRPEKEIPMVMLALVGAAIHASLLDWRSGDFTGASSFSADKYVDAYKEHLVLLEAIKSNSAVKYHTMMYKLYNTASAATSVTDASSGGALALTRLNLDAMEED
ncbi:hypothetical protein NUW54_g5369 [Trametes sanguinea]|uniref:Uncharacterized protein n=1 Tax=Trametes sanguinea TaxID=158606 RepID=A0ACC1PV94_9APHY|nr:hypothetical protein NUW54_g5369 [Trametes sanguinea]